MRWTGSCPRPTIKPIKKAQTTAIISTRHSIAAAALEKLTVKRPAAFSEVLPLARLLRNGCGILNSFPA
jgi:HD superfamily phosphodiesterase